MKLIIDISKDRYNEIMAMDWKNGTRIYDEDIRAIHEGTSIEQEPCEDCIRKQDEIRKAYDRGIENGLIPKETCEDAISREGTASFLQDIINDIPKNKEGKYNSEFAQYVNGLDRAITIIKFVMPPVTPQPKIGHWVDIDEEPHEVWECDHCGFVIDGSGCIDPYDYRDTYKFCPNCGCRMSEIPTGSESEDKE